MTLIILIVFAFVAAGTIFYLVTLYNGLVEVKNDIDKAWANIDVLLKQRHDELPKLVESCKGYMRFEKDTFEKIASARSMYAQATTVDQKAQAESAHGEDQQEPGVRGCQRDESQLPGRESHQDQARK